MNNFPQIHHGIINVGDLPIPFDMVLNAAVLTIVLTFVFLKVSWKESILTSTETLFPTKQSTSGKLFGLFILSLLTIPGLINNEPATVSITPLVLWVFLWIGVPVLGLLFGDLYAEGYKFLVIAGIITVLFYTFSDFLGLIGLVLTIWVYYFFRDPERVIIDDDNYLVSPADGEIIKVEEVDGPKELGLENKRFQKISVFMNVFDCHVNRTPCGGKIEAW